MSRQRAEEVVAQSSAGAERWIFGYGSLVWRPAFDHVEQAPGFVRGFARRLWQGSPDHRGVPNAPGRVVTLVPEADAVCWGMGYRVEPGAWEEVLRVLDETIELTSGHDGMVLCLAISYGGRAEIVDAVRELAGRVSRGELEPDAIDEAAVAGALYWPELRDPDLLIRTAGERRISNFLL